MQRFNQTRQRPQSWRRLFPGRSYTDPISTRQLHRAVCEAAEAAGIRKRVGARIGITAVLHTWGSAMTHHPHVHMIVPGGGIARDGTRWISSRPAFLLPVKVLGKLFRRLFLTRLLALHASRRLAFFGVLAHLTDRRALLRRP